MTVRDSDKSIIQFQYGEDSLDVCKSQYLIANQMKFLYDNRFDLSSSLLDKVNFYVNLQFALDNSPPPTLFTLSIVWNKFLLIFYSSNKLKEFVLFSIKKKLTISNSYFQRRDCWSGNDGESCQDDRPEADWEV